MIDDIEERLHSALDELTGFASLRHADGPRAGSPPLTAPPLGSVTSSPVAFGAAGDSGGRRPGGIDPKLMVIAACVVVFLVGLGLAGLIRAQHRSPSKTVSTSTSIPSPVTTVPVAPSTTIPRSATTTVPAATTPSTAELPSTSLPISVQSDSQMQAAGDDGPSSSILLPSACTTSGSTVTATGTYLGGFAPNVYNRYGDVVVLYVYGAPSSGYPDGAQLGASPVSSSPAMGSGAWRVSTTVDLSAGQPASCVISAQPTHEIQLAP
jgi:cytoskeletal protein RodZ